jgi:hypothetical protein
MRIEHVEEPSVFTGDHSPTADSGLTATGAFAESERALIRGLRHEGSPWPGNAACTG